MPPKIIIILLILGGFPAYASANPKKNEKYYQQKWCKEHQGKIEVVLKDQTRVDCITKKYAIEFDFARKWAEAIGQSLHYSIMTEKQAGIVLIMRSKKDQKYLERIEEINKKYDLDIKIWVINAY